MREREQRGMQQHSCMPRSNSYASKRAVNPDKDRTLLALFVQYEVFRRTLMACVDKCLVSGSRSSSVSDPLSGFVFGPSFDGMGWVFVYASHWTSYRHPMKTYIHPCAANASAPDSVGQTSRPRHRWSLRPAGSQGSTRRRRRVQQRRRRRRQQRRGHRGPSRRR